MEIDKCRKEFERYVLVEFEEPHVFAVDGILDKTSLAKGILREYVNQETELMWRAFKKAWFFKK